MLYTQCLPKELRACPNVYVYTASNMGNINFQMIQSLFAIYLQTAGRLNADYQKKTMKNPQNKVLAISSRFLRLNKFNQNLLLAV